ncbi:type IV toxin-antitoxin system AbiEi family antitoxin domain-containing protein [Nocardioides caeni]|uniref:Type IV toxin-antitoxin system AbiEi family antitoxin domain-containing protein n=1 Tax=Nocardioides caeni TaxID=574700 RepID=A0A4V4HLG7_9ACTN|nr:type IV toxin-antitoxin system AbiEi family antitoxin domain-containing protein [Nocardioides caeni]THV18226.1 hypothetical protein E9934_00840 [Nocardioides caeni]
MDPLVELLERQNGVIARRQVLDCGHSPTFVARKLRRREWVAVHPGVYINHTGPLTWRQRAWAAVLVCWPAALAGWSAVRAHEGPGRHRHDDARPIEVVVRRGHGPDRREGVEFRESRRFDETVQVHLSPPRQRYDSAIVELAERASRELDAIAILADACGSRRTTAARLLRALESMSRVRRRALLVGVLTDVAEGTCSVLEHGYLTRVERPHGLPSGLRQVAGRAGGRRLFRDVVYRGAGTSWEQIVELDGRLGHDTTRDRDRDLERDLDAALGGADTVRLGFGQVFDRSCSTAAKLGRLLQQRGWQGSPVLCPSCPRTDRPGSVQAG